MRATFGVELRPTRTVYILVRVKRHERLAGNDLHGMLAGGDERRANKGAESTTVG